MPTTNPDALPYPILTDTPDVPRDIKALADRMQAILALPPVFGVGSSSAVRTLSTGVTANIRIDTSKLVQGGVTVDTANWALVVPAAGHYVVKAQIYWAANAAGYRKITVYANSVVAVEDTTTAVSGLVMAINVCSAPMYLPANAQVYAAATQTSGGNLDIAVGSWLSVERVK